MCGLFGYTIVSPAEKDSDVELWTMLVKAMRVAASKRGTDSWGYAGYDSRGRHRVRRGMGNIATEKGGQPPRSLHTVIAHTRLATVGKVCLANAHPFRFGSVIGAHNGGIWGGYTRKDFDVDSMALIDAIASGSKVIDQLSGYGACHWLDVEDGKTYLCRMAQGDLDCYRVSIGRFRAFCWISDLSVLRLIARILPPRVKFSAVPELRAGHVYEVAKGGLVRTKRRIELGGYSRYSYTSGYSGGRRDTSPLVSLADVWNQTVDSRVEGPFHYAWTEKKHTGSSSMSYYYWLCNQSGDYFREEGYLGGFSMLERVGDDILIPIQFSPSSRYWWVLEPKGDICVLDTHDKLYLDIETRATIGAWAGEFKKASDA